MTDTSAAPAASSAAKKVTGAFTKGLEKYAIELAMLPSRHIILADIG